MTATKWSQKIVRTCGLFLAGVVGLTGLESKGLAAEQEYHSDTSVQIAQTSNAASTLSDLISGISVPGLDNLPVSNVSSANGVTSADVTLRGETISVFAFTPDGANRKIVAVLPQTFSLSDFLPIPSGSPVDNVTFEDMAFIFVPGSDPISDVTTANLPSTVSTALSHSGTTVDLKAGMNLFGRADLSGVNSIKTALSQVGITEVSFPLNGTLPDDLLSHDPKAAATSIKNQILDNLNFALPLPALSIPGVPGDVSFQNSTVAISGKNDNGTRSLEMDVVGVVEITEGSSTVDFDFEVDVVNQSGTNKLKITATETAGSTLSVPAALPITLNNLTLEMDNLDSSGWTTSIGGQATIKGNQVDLSYLKKPNARAVVDVEPKNLTLAKLIDSPGLPGLDDVTLKSIKILSDYWLLHGTFKGQDGWVYVQPSPYGIGHYIAAYLYDMNLGDVIPGASSTPLKDVDFSNLVLFYNPVKSTLAWKDTHIVGDAAPWIEQSNPEGVTIKAGLNVFGHMNIHPGGQMANLFDKVGLNEVSLPLNGTIGKDLLQGSPGDSIKDAILNSLDIQADLPTISIPGLPGKVNIQSSHLSIVGKSDGGNRSVDVDVAGVLDVTHGSKTVDFDFEVDVIVQSGADKLKITASETASSSLSLSSVIPLTLTNLSFEADNFDPDGWATAIKGDATIKNTQVNINYTRAPGKDYEIDVEPENLTLAKLIDSPGLPGLDDVTLKSIQLFSGHWLLHGTFKGQDGWVYAQPSPYGKGHYIAAYLDDMNLGDVIPGASSTPLKDVDFDNLVLFHSPVKSALVWKDTHIVGDAAPWIEQSNPKGVTIKAGLNVFGHMNIKPGGDLKSLLSDVNVTDVKLPLTGTIGKDLLHGNPTQSIKDAILASLDLHLPISTPSIPGIDDVLTFSDGKLHVTGTLPDGTAGLEVEVSGNASVPIASSTHAFAIDVRYDRTPGSGTRKLTVSGTSTSPWNSPFGISWIDLKSLGITVDKENTTGGTKWDFQLSAKTDIGQHSDLDVSIDVNKENGKLVGSEIGLTGPLDLSEIPGIKDIPEVNSLTIKSIAVSTHGIDAKTTFNGAETDFFAFKASNDWIVAFAQKDFAITELIPQLSTTPLTGLKMSEAAVIVAENGLNGSISTFGPIAQDAFEVIYGVGNDAIINLGQGISLVTAFKHKESSGLVGDGLARLGLDEERVVLTGDIGGILGNSQPHVNLTVDISLSGEPKHMPSGASVTAKEELVFSIIATESADNFDIEIGIGVDVDMVIGSDELVFGGKMGLEFQPEKVDVKFVMKLKVADLSTGKPKDNGILCSLTNTASFHPAPGPAGWHNPFGIPGFTLYDVIMDMGIDEDGAIHLGFAGGAKIGDDRFCIATDADPTPEGAGLPQDMAFEGAIDHIEPEFLQNLAVQVAEDVIRSAGGSGVASDLAEAYKVEQMLKGLPQPEFKNVAFAFVTPGADDPDLNITGEGVALRGELYWLHKELGSIDVAIGPSTGFKFDGTIGDKNGNLTFGPIEIKSTKIDVKVPFPPSNPLNGHFKLNGDVDIPVLAIDTNVDVDLTSKRMSFTESATIFADFSESITLVSDNLDLSLSHPPMENADFAISATLTADFGTFIKNAMKTTLNTLFDDLNKFYADGVKKVEAAKATVKSWNKKIKAERAKVRAEQAKIEAKVDAARAKVDDLQHDIDHAWHKYHSCHWYNAAWCKPRWALTIAGEKAAKGLADLVLDAFEKLVEHFPVDFDPRVWALIVSKDAAVGVLDLAEFAIKGLESLDGYLTKGLDAIENTAGGSVNLKKATFNGSLRDAIDDKPVDLYVDVELFGSNFSDTFAFTLTGTADELANLGTDTAKDLAHLSLLGYVGVYHMFDKVLSDIPGIFKRQLAHHLGDKLGDAQAAANEAVVAHETDFKKYHETATAVRSTMSSFTDTFADTLLALPPSSPLDREPASLTFSNEQIEIGQSGMCLGMSPEGDHGIDSCLPAGNNWRHNQIVSTESLIYPTGKNAGQPNGYVKVSRGNECLNVAGSWAYGEVNYGSGTDQHFVDQYIFTLSSDIEDPYGIPEWNICDDTADFHWKILEHGDGYYQFHNRETLTCMWMDISEDQGGYITETLEMIPCVGARTQVFRLAQADVQSVRHTVGLPLVRSWETASSENCVSTDSTVSGWLDQGSCTTAAKVNTSSSGSFFNSNSTGKGYDTYDYFTDSLGRRRFKSTKVGNSCLEYTGPWIMDTTHQKSVFNAQSCDSANPNQWMDVSPVIGGLHFQPNSINTALTSKRTLVDPLTVYLQRQDPTSGAQWSNKAADSSTWNVAYTAQDQAAPGIQARAIQWTSIKTALDGKMSDLSQGKTACTEPGGKLLCYLLAPPTGYISDPTDPTKLVPTVHSYSILPQASIIADDVGLAINNTLPTVIPATEPVWNICRAASHMGGAYNSTGGPYYIPGVTKSSTNCDFVADGYKLPGTASMILHKAKDLFWQPAGAGYLPATAVPVGRYPYDRTKKTLVGMIVEPTVTLTDYRPVFSCRTMVGRQTRIGWTFGGRYCHIVNGTVGAVVEHFEVLTLDISKTVHPATGGAPIDSGGMSGGGMQ